MGGIKLQLLCGVRIELAVGSLIPGSLKLQLLGGRRGFNPPWARGYIPNKRRPISGTQNPGPTKPKQTSNFDFIYSPLKKQKQHQIFIDSLE